MISVIIPVVNESETVGQVVQSALAHPQVDEVIVVDDGSIDDTPNQARQAGARVLTSTFLGKGASLQDGINAARNKILVFLDAHLTGLPRDLITNLAQPLMDNKADLTKANSNGSTTNVCRLNAKPLLGIFFPELNHIEYPLSGIWAAKRSLLQKTPLAIDYGVEIGVLLDSFCNGARIQQVETGDIFLNEDGSGLLEEIAQEVTRTILDRAARENRLKASYLSEVLENTRQDQSDLARMLHRLEPADRVALFDMDGVLVRGSFILDLAYDLGKGAELAEYLDNPDLPGDELTEKIAALFSGVPRETFERVAREMHLMPGAREIVAALRKRGYLVGIVSDGFSVAAEIVRCRLLADFCIANVLKFRRGKSTGRFTFAPAMTPLTQESQGRNTEKVSPWLDTECYPCRVHSHCKANIVPYLVDLLGISPEHILAIGNSENDVCLLRVAGHSVAYRPTHPGVRAAAEQTLEGALTDLLDSLEELEVPVSR